MKDTSDARRERYSSARDAFDELKLEDKAVFLVEATVSTFARGLEDAVTTLADEVGSIFTPRPAGDEPATPPEAPGPAQPETAKTKAPRTRKKTQAKSKSTSARAKTTGKKATSTTSKSTKSTSSRSKRKASGDEDAS